VFQTFYGERGSLEAKFLIGRVFSLLLVLNTSLLTCSDAQLRNQHFEYNCNGRIGTIEGAREVAATWAFDLHHCKIIQPDVYFDIHHLFVDQQ
jgi:hypothetical protein